MKNNEKTDSFTILGSVGQKGDKVKFKYWEDDFHQAYAYGTVESQLNENISIVKVVLPGRKKDLVTYHEVPVSELEPHFADENELDEPEEYDELEAI